MTCDQVQRGLSILLDEEAADGHLDFHLDTCEECRQFRDISLGVAGAYRSEVSRRIEALRRLTPPGRRPRLALVAAVLLAGVAVGLVSKIPVRKGTLVPSEAMTAKLPSLSPPPKKLLLFVEEPRLPGLLSAEPEAPRSEWVRDLPARLSEDLPPPVLRDLPARFSEDS